jgi:hypothetical protein
VIFFPQILSKPPKSSRDGVYKKEEREIIEKRGRKEKLQEYGHIDSFGMFEQGSTLVLSQISCIASCLALLKDEQNFKLVGCVGAHKTSISCANMSSKCIK